MNYEYMEIQELLQQRADLQARLKLLPYDGSPDIKERGESKYLTSDEISRIQEAINNSHGVLNVIEKGQSLSQEAELKTDIYIDSLIPKKRDK